MAYPSASSQANWALGGFAGGGFNFYVTNAGNLQSLKGPLRTYSLNVGWGLRVLSMQFQLGANGTWVLSYGGPVPGIGPTGGGFGGSFSVYNTNTWTWP